MNNGSNRQRMRFKGRKFVLKKFSDKPSKEIWWYSPKRRRKYLSSSVSKLLLHSVMNSLREDLLPCQLGVGVRFGCESAVHATRSFINHSVDP